MAASFPTSLPSFKQAVNNKKCTLTTDYKAGDSIINVVSTTGTPDAPGAFHIGTDIIFYTGKTATSFTGCVGGQDGTSNVDHSRASGGNEIVFGPEAHYFTSLQEEVVALATKVGIDSSADTDSHDYKISDLETVITSIVSSATPTPARASTKTVLKITAQSGAFELQNPTGTPVEGDMLKVEVTDNGTPVAITYDTGYADGTAERATTTTASTRLMQIFEYDGSSWKCEHSAEDV